MANSYRIVFSGAVEGSLDEVVLRRVVQHAGGTLERVYGKKGKNYLRQNLSGYDRAARFWPWVVLVDLNQEYDCAPLLRADWLPSPAQSMCFRVAVREIEAWLLADRERLARFLSVPVLRIPRHPETVDDPKRKVVELARSSRRRQVREDMVPRPGSGRPVGPAYDSHLIEFAGLHWRPSVAALNSDSLRRCYKRLKELVERAQGTVSQ